MALEFSSSAAVLGRFGTVCDGALLDWRRKCRDEILERVPMLLVDQFFDDITFRALINDKTSINFREAFAYEGGTANPDCCPSTANNEIYECEFNLPDLQRISIGTEPECYEDLRKRFCQTFPMYKTHLPFARRGNEFVLLDGVDESASNTFVTWIQSALSQAIWNHMYQVAWVGRDEWVDSHNGIMYWIDNGLSNNVEGTCDDFPLQPFQINMAEYILGAAAAAGGGLVGPGDVVLAVGDADRPVDAPADNVITVHPNTIYETTIDITGFDTVDMLTMWYEFIVNEWAVDVQEWMIGVPRGKTKCLAQVAACKQSCSGDCRHLLVGDDRDRTRADREAQYIRDRSITLYPYTEMLPMRQSPVLDDFDRILFLPETFTDGEGNTSNWIVWTWLNQRGENARMFSDMPELVDALDMRRGDITAGFDGEYYDGDEFRDTPELFEQAAWDWLYQRHCNSIQWYNNAQATMVPQCPWLWLVIDGVDCSKVLVLPCPPATAEFALTACAQGTPGAGFTSALDLTYNDPDQVATFALADIIDYIDDAGTVHEGEVTAVNIPAGTVTIEFVTEDLVCPATVTDARVREGINK